MAAYLSALGRILLGALFLMMALSKMGVIGVLGTPDDYQQFIAAYGIPLPTLAYWLALLLELAAGAMLIAGYRTRWAAWLLAAYLVPVTLFFHTELSDPNQFVKFVKNLALIGALLIVAEAAPLPMSVDEKNTAQS